VTPARTGPRPLLDAAQAAELLNVPPSWVLDEARADRIPHVRLGRYVRFDPEALEEWWRSRVRGPIRGNAKTSAKSPSHRNGSAELDAVL
jgi:excisionase family DNA binding protein